MVTKKTPVKKTAKKRAVKKVAQKAAAKRRTKKVPSSNGKEKLHPEIVSEIYDETNPLSESACKELLGWQEVEKGKAMFTDFDGTPISCANSKDNRKLTRGNWESLKQQILRGRWRLNGESIVIGEYGAVLNGNHTMIAVVLACQEYRNEPEAFPYWEERGEEPWISKTAWFGIAEDDDTVNTIDTAKPRTLADVIYRSVFFRDMPSSKRSMAARAADYAVRLIWQRTAAGIDPYSVKRTHSESLDLIDRHSLLLSCVRYILEADHQGSISALISQGTAAGLLYLMSASASDYSYYMADKRSEANLDMSMADKAEKFWDLIANDADEMKPLHKATARCVQKGEGGKKHEVIAVLAKAWNLFAKNGKLNDKSLTLKYTNDEDGLPVLAECPVFGGIDLGDDAEPPEDAMEEKMSPEEIRARAEEIRESKEEKDETLPKSRKTARKKTTKHLDPWEIEEGQEVIVRESDEASWRGTFSDSYIEDDGRIICKVRVCSGFAGAGNTINVDSEAIFSE